MRMRQELTWMLAVVLVTTFRPAWCWAAGDGPNPGAVPGVGAGATPGAVPGAATLPVKELDLSGFDADGLRLLASTLYKSLDESRQSMAELRLQVAHLKAENARLQAELGRSNPRRSDPRSLDPRSSDPRSSDPRTPEPRSSDGSSGSVRLPEAQPTPPPTKDTATDPVRGASKQPPLVTPGIEKRIREQATDFRQLNAAPQTYLAKGVTVLGYAETTDHHSEGWMSDSGSPRKFLAIKDHRGESVYLSFPIEGNSELLKLLNGVSSSRRLAIRCQVSGISTRQGSVFEGAIQRWETVSD